MRHFIRALPFLILLQVSLLSQPKELTFDDLFTRTEFLGRSLSGFQWIPGGGKFSYLKYDTGSLLYNIIRHDIKTGEESVIVNGNVLKTGEGTEPFRIQNYLWASGGKYILFTGTVPARKVKSGGAFYIYNTSINKFIVLAESEKEQLNAAFSPDGQKVGFVRGNNLFAVDIETRKETQLTFDGNENILNGVFDWVYEEEFSIIMGWEWSPDSKSIAYWRLDQSNVPDLYIASWDSLYMQPVKMKYPKPGASNSLVKIGVVDISSAETIWMDLGEEKDIYIPRMKFTKDPGKVAIQRLNRLQNKLELLLADIRTGKSKVIMTETSDAWVEVVDELAFLENGEQFIWSSERDGYKHLYMYNINGSLQAQLTKGEWEINALTGVNEEDSEIFFTANERGTIYSDLYSVKYDGSGFTRITQKPGNHSINISDNKNYYIDKYSTANSPAVTSLYASSGEKIRDLAVPDTAFIKEYDFAPLEFFSFTTTDGVELNASIMKPDNFDSSKKYPVIFNVYGGPGSSSVTDSWGGFGSIMNQYFVKQGYIIFNLDNRGTGNRGTKFRHIAYKNLGKWEVDDMTEGAKYLIAQGYADPERIGIKGSSYGGYTAAIVLMNASEYFKAAAGVAGVYDWRFYDNIYTERFMQTPELNPDGYRESSVLTHADKLRGKLLLIHGTADDNVHFQNAVKLSERLIEFNKQFEIMFYPEQKHGIRGKASRHYYRKLIDFFDINLKGRVPQQVTEN